LICGTIAREPATSAGAPGAQKRALHVDHHQRAAAVGADNFSFSMASVAEIFWRLMLLSLLPCVRGAVLRAAVAWRLHRRPSWKIYTRSWRRHWPHRIMVSPICTSIPPCTSGWRFPSGNNIEVARKAVETNFAILWEYEPDQGMRLSRPIDKPLPVVEYLKLLGKFNLFSSVTPLG